MPKSTESSPRVTFTVLQSGFSLGRWRALTTPHSSLQLREPQEGLQAGVGSCTSSSRLGPSGRGSAAPKGAAGLSDGRRRTPLQRGGHPAPPAEPRRDPAWRPQADRSCRRRAARPRACRAPPGAGKRGDGESAAPFRFLAFLLSPTQECFTSCKLTKQCHCMSRASAHWIASLCFHS